MTGALASAVALAVLLIAVAHGFARHGWRSRLAAVLRRRPAPPPAPHHERHLARLARARTALGGRHDHH